MLQSCHIPYLGSNSGYAEVAFGVAPLKVYKNASSSVDFIAYSPLFTLHMLLYSICIPADPSEMCRSEFCCFALGLTASPSGQTACCFFSPMKINAMNNAIRSILAGTLTNKSAWFFIFYFFTWACLWGGFLCSVSIMNPSHCRFRSRSVRTLLSQSFVSARINYSRV